MTPIFVPRESVNDESVVVQKVLIASGSIAKAGQVVVELETSKTALEIESPETGLIAHNLSIGQEVAVGALLFIVGVQGADGPAAASDPQASTVAALPADSAGLVPIITPAAAPPVAAPNSQADDPPVLSKAAVKFAGESSYSLNAFQGRWVTRADVQRGHPAGSPAEARNAQHTAPHFIIASPAANAAAPRSALPSLPYEEKIKSKRKRAEIDNLLKGQHAATASTIGLRIELPGERIVRPDFLFEDSISDLIIFEGARLLRQYPELNGFNIDERRWGQYTEVNFGVSFDSGQNLKVLSLRSADSLSLPELHKALSNLLDFYESNKHIADVLLSTATVTISDLSTTSASFMLPLINGQQSLILGVLKHHRGLFEVFASFDHRVSEGLRVTRFLQTLRDRIVSHYRDEHGFARLNCSICGASMQDELRLGRRGFLNLTLPNGNSALLCRNCFEGW